MSIHAQISGYLDSLPAVKQQDMRTLHEAILAMFPGCEQWFSDGRDETGKVVSNPSIGYGRFTKKYADGQTRDGFQAGISANASGLSVYIMGLDDRNYLPQKYAAVLPKAKVTGYCIKFKALKDIDQQTLLAAIADGVAQTSA